MTKRNRFLFLFRLEFCSVSLKFSIRNSKPVILVCAIFFALSLPAEAQRARKVPRIGRLSPISASAGVPIEEAFRQGLQDLGYVEGKNIAIEYRFAEGKHDRLHELALDLVRLDVDLILVGSTQGALAAKKVSGKIPIVMVTTGDPVASGVVASLAQPGGNITGLTALSRELSAKRLEVLREAVPTVNRLGVLLNPAFEDSGHP